MAPNDLHDADQKAEVIHWRIPEWFKELQPDNLKKLKIYHDELIKNNRHINLLSAKSVFAADLLHFADTILASQIIVKSNNKLENVYDFGSGSGFPGVVFAILNPKIKVSAVESDAKKANFLSSVAQSLKLSNFEVDRITIESLPEGSVQFAMARGLGSLSKVLYSTRKVFAKGGIFYHLKGDEWGLELSELPSQLCSVWSPALLGQYKLPSTQFQLSVIKTEKIS